MPNSEPYRPSAHGRCETSSYAILGGNVPSVRGGYRPSNMQLRSTVAEWVERQFDLNAMVFAVTLTCKQAIRNDRGGFTRLTLELLSREVALFMNRLDRRVLGHAAKRFDRTLRRMSAIEGGGSDGKNLHAHLLIEFPPCRWTWWELTMLVRSEWKKSPWALPMTHMDPAPEILETVSYLGKTGMDAIDWPNTIL